MVVETTDGTLAAVLRYLSARRACVRTASHSAKRGKGGHGRNKHEPRRWFGNCRNLGETHVVEARPQRKQKDQTSGAAAQREGVQLRSAVHGVGNRVEQAVARFEQQAAVEAQAAISHVKLEGQRTRKKVEFIQGARHAIDVGPQYVQLSVLAIESQTTRKQAAALKAQAEVQNLCDRRGAEVQPVEKRVAAARVIGDRIEIAIGGVEGKAAKESHSRAEGCGQRATAAPR